MKNISEFLKENESQNISKIETTQFSLNLHQLYDGIKEIYPTFPMLNNSFNGSEKPLNLNERIMIDQELKEDTNMLALQLYNDLEYMYKQAQSNIQSHESMNLQINQFMKENQELEKQLDISQKELAYYKI